VASNIDASRMADLELVRQLAIASPLVQVAAPCGTGNTVWLKVESAQPVRSFKIRGATYALATNLERLRARGVVADSGGNHSQALAFAGARLGVPVKIVMAALVPEGKKAATRGFGAMDGSFELDATPADFVLAKQKARDLARREGLHYLSPYDDEDIIRGAATLVPELVEQFRLLGAPLPDAVHVPVGGGGLISGIADVNAESGHLFAVYGHEVVDADSAARSFHSSSPVPIVGTPSRYAEGLAVQVMGALPHRRLIEGKVDRILVSGLEDVGRAYEWYRQVVLAQIGVDVLDEEAYWASMPEVSSMVAVAGLFQHLRRTRATNETHLVIITGGNTDRSKAEAVMAAHLGDR